MRDIIYYSDSDHAVDVDIRRSVSGFVVIMNGAPVLWKSTKQATVATLTCEAEFIAASMACKDTIWCQQLLSELGVKPCPIKIDNQEAIKILTNLQLHAKGEHMDIEYMYVRELIDNEQGNTIVRPRSNSEKPVT